MNLSFQQYLNVRWATGASFRHDATRMAFITDITGTGQLWVTNGPLRWPEQLTFYEDRLMFARYSPTDPVIAFGRDSGGDENQLVFLIDEDGGAARQLSVQKAKHHWGGWSPDGKRIAWTHNGRNGRDFDLYVYDLATGEETLLLETDGYWTVDAWLPNGSGLIVGAYASNVENNLYLVRFDDPTPKLLTPHEGTATFLCPQPNRDGSKVYVQTNIGGEFRNLAVISLPACEIALQTPDARWDVEEIALSRDDRWMVVVRNEAGFSSVRLLDAESGEERALNNFPAGVAGGARWIRDSHRFSITVSGTADATDIFVVDAESGAVERWTRSAMAGIPRSSLVAPELVEFESFDGLQIPAFYWKPTTPGPYPVVIDIHGGPEGQRRPNFAATVQYFLQRGIAVLGPNVRGSSGYGKTFMSLDDVRKRMDSVADLKAAHHWLVTAGEADPKRIVLKGGSYGGFMVLSGLVTYPDLWAGGIDIVGIANFVSFLQNTSEYRRHLREPEYGSLERDGDFLHDISPLTHIDKINAPLMVIHGKNDPRVPVSEAEQVVDACRAKGLPVECIIYDDEGHGLAKRANRLDAYPRILEFLEEHLGL